MILEGPSVMSKNEQGTVMGSNTGVALSQPLIFNAVKRHRDPQSDVSGVRHDPNREPPSGTVSPRRNQEENLSR